MTASTNQAMANLVSYQAILFPSDDRTPHLVALATSPINTSGVPVVAEPFRCGRMPHPEDHQAAGHTAANGESEPLLPQTEAHPHWRHTFADGIGTYNTPYVPNPSLMII